MELLTPSKFEASQLLVHPCIFRSIVVQKEALPPSFLLESAIAEGADTWLMPRLFCDTNSGQIVGSGGFKSVPQHGKVEIGYGVAPSCQGRGYATAGVRLLVWEAYESGLVDEVFAEVHVDNTASRRVLEKLGFSYDGTKESNEGILTLWRTRKD